MTREQENAKVIDGLPLVLAVLRSFRVDSDTRAELRQVGMISLWRCIQRFDDTPGKFASYVSHSVRLAMLQCLEQRRVVRPPQSGRNRNAKLFSVSFDPAHDGTTPPMEGGMEAALLAPLTELEREVVIRHAVFEEKDSEISRPGLSARQVNKLRHRAFKKIRESAGYPAGGLQ